MKYFLKTYGCQMNVHDSEKISGILSEAGYQPVDESKKADVVVLNTCNIRQKAAQKLYSDLGRLKIIKKQRPGLRIAVAGCIAQQEGRSIFKRFPYVDYIFGPSNIGNLNDWVLNNNIRTALEDNPDYHTKVLPLNRVGQVRAWVSIMYGCDNFCAYCVVPYTRGREKSRPVKDILTEVQGLAKDGYKEITLLGQNVNSYGKNLIEEMSFPDLLKALHEVEGIDRIRFVTSHPKDFSEDLVRTVKDLPKVCKHIHLPLQAGSDRVLSLMNRRYTYIEYKEKIDKLRLEIPKISVTTDIITGFPGETEDDFEDTLNALREIEYDGIFAFKYSKRPGTRALELPGHLDEEVKSRRLSKVLELQELITYRKNRELEGIILEVLIEGVSQTDPEKLTGRTKTNKIVNFNGEKKEAGSTVNIKILEAKQHSLFGEKVN
jgi:tRNA-2-methylthio-N6-dimethylallyladenosine synthase